MLEELKEKKQNLIEKREKLKKEYKECPYDD